MSKQTSNAANEIKSASMSTFDAKIVVNFPPEAKNNYAQIISLTKGKMSPAAFMRTAVDYYLKQIANGKVVF